MQRILAGTVAFVAVLMVPGLLMSQAPRPAIRDSAGIQIVAYDSTAVPPRLELRDRGLDIGSEPGSELVRVMGALRMPNGTILVADGGQRHLIRFGSDGRLEKVIGRDGEGPGEFGRLGWLGRHDRNTVATYDFGLARYSVFSDSGFLRQVVLQRSTEVRFAEMVPLGVLPDGGIIVTGGASIGLAAEGPPRLFRQVSPVVQYGAQGTPGRVIGRYPGREIEVTMVKNGPAAGTFANAPRVFGRSSALGMVDGHLIVVDNERFQFDVIDTSGRLVRRVRRAVTNERVRPSQVQAYVQERVNAARPQFRDRVREDLEDLQHAPTFPALEAQLVLDATNRIWVSEYKRPGDREQAWWIFTPAGQMVGTVRVPIRLMITDAGTDWVLGVWRDEDGVQTVRLYDLRPVSGRG